MDFNQLTIKELHYGLLDKEFSALELCNFYLSQIKQKDKDIKAFLSINPELVLSQAKEVDELLRKAGETPILTGIPCAIKDAILVKGLTCTAGSRILENYKAPYNAFCIEKLLENKAVILGKTNLDEFAMGSSTENSGFQKTANPNDLTRVPGGSSGGSAAAVSANEAVFSLGSDTGGSIRQPASFCGVVGLKPTYGAVSRRGLIAFGSSLDQIGPLAKTVDDCEIVFETIKGKDPKDSTSVEYLNSKYEILNSKQILNPKFQIQNCKIGIPKEYFGEGLDREVGDSINKVIKLLEKEGADIVEVSLPHTKYALPCYYIIATSEASANLARYDGIKYGLSVQDKEDDLLNVYLKSRGQGFGSEVKRRIMLGTFVLSSGYYDAYYLRAQKVRALLKAKFEDVFNKADFILTPVSPFLPFKLGEKIDDPLKMYLSDVYTVSVNLVGLPALSMPCAKIGNLPVGLQIIGPAFSEKGIFALGKAIENLLK